MDRDSNSCVGAAFMKPIDLGDELESSKQLTFSFERIETESAPVVPSVSTCFDLMQPQCSRREKASAIASGVVLTFSVERRKAAAREALISRIMHRTRFF